MYIIIFHSNDAVSNWLTISGHELIRIQLRCGNEIKALESDERQRHYSDSTLVMTENHAYLLLNLYVNGIVKLLHSLPIKSTAGN